MSRSSLRTSVHPAVALVEGTKAKAVEAPKQPTQQEILEHNVTHLPYRSWCPICVQARGKQNSHPQQHSKLPITQLDFGYIKGFDDSDVHPILIATNIESGMIMAIQPTDKRALFDYAVTQLQRFLIECGKTTHTILQSDQEDFLTALTTAVANRNSNITTRNTGAYSSQSQGGVEKTVCANQNTQGTNQAELQQRHSNETSTHALDCSAQRAHHEQVCSPQQWMHSEYMLPTVEQIPKPEPRFYNGIWLGKDTTAGESLLWGSTTGLSEQGQSEGRIRPHKYNQQQLDCVNTGPWKTPASALPTPTLTTQLTMPATSKAPPSQKDATTSAAAQGKKQSTSQATDQQTRQKKTAEPTSPMATSPTHRLHRSPQKYMTQ